MYIKLNLTGYIISLFILLQRICGICTLIIHRFQVDMLIVSIIVIIHNYGNLFGSTYMMLQLPGCHLSSSRMYVDEYQLEVAIQVSVIYLKKKQYSLLAIN